MPVNTKCIYCIGRYPEYHSVCPLVWIGTPHPLPPVSVYPPLNQRSGEHTRLRVRGWGSLNSDYWRKSLALCLHFESLAARSTLSCREHIYLCDTIIVYPVPNQTVCTRIYVAYNYVSMWNMYNRMKPPYFSLNIGLLFSYFFRIRNRTRNIYFGSGSDPDPAKSFGSLRIRIRNTAHFGFGSRSGQMFWVLTDPDPVPDQDPQHCSD